MLTSTHLSLQFYLDVCEYTVTSTSTDDITGLRDSRTDHGTVLSPLGPWAREDLPMVLHCVESAVYHRSQAQSRRLDRNAQ